MSNLHEYLSWRGSFPFCRACPFNELDGMLVARLAFLPYDNIDLAPEETVRSVAEKMKDLNPKVYKHSEDPSVLQEMGESVRFADVCITDYVKDNDRAEERQFSAVTIHIDDKHICLSFCGTDTTLLGWKEDLNMSFLQNVPAQLSALSYTKSIAAKYPNTRLWLGGHSKGGNVAVYSAVRSPENIRKRIDFVCNFDGPGFPADFVESEEYAELVNKIHTFIPQGSIFGRLLEHGEQMEVVKSDNLSLYQHDIYSWEVMGDTIVRVPSTTDNSNFNQQSIRRILELTTPEERMLFLDTVYSTVTSGTATTLKNLLTTLPQNLPAMLNTVSSLTEAQKKNVMAMFGDFAKAYAEVFAEIQAQRLVQPSVPAPVQDIIPAVQNMLPTAVTEHLSPVLDTAAEAAAEPAPVAFMRLEDKVPETERILTEAREADERKAAEKAQKLEEQERAREEARAARRKRAKLAAFTMVLAVVCLVKKKKSK